MCLKHDEVVDILISIVAEQGPMSPDALYDEMIRQVGARYYFTSDYTLDDMISDQVTARHLRYDETTKLLSCI